MMETHTNALDALAVRAAREQIPFRFTLDCGNPQLNQQAENYLRANGFELGIIDGLPAFRMQSVIITALTRLWKADVPCWQGLERQLIDSGVCTREEFAARKAQT